MTYLRMMAAISTVAIICVSVPIFFILIFQTSKRYDFDSVWACVSHAATCHDNHQVALAQRHLLLMLLGKVLMMQLQWKGLQKPVLYHF